MTTRGLLERAKGIEPSFSAWEADVLPLNYARSIGVTVAWPPECQASLSPAGWLLAWLSTSAVWLAWDLPPAGRVGPAGVT